MWKYQLLWHSDNEVISVSLTFWYGRNVSSSDILTIMKYHLLWYSDNEEIAVPLTFWQWGTISSPDILTMVKYQFLWHSDNEEISAPLTFLYLFWNIRVTQFSMMISVHSKINQIYIYTWKRQSICMLDWGGFSPVFPLMDWMGLLPACSARPAWSK